MMTFISCKPVYLCRQLTLSLPVPSWASHNTQLPLYMNILETIRVSVAFTQIFFKEYSISFLMLCRLINFALAVLILLMFKVCGIIGISKSRLSNFPVLKQLKKKKKTFKDHSKPPKLVSQSLFKEFQQILNIFFFTETLTLLLPVPHWAGDSTDLPSDSNISSKRCPQKKFFKEYSISFLMVCRLRDFVPLVLKLLIFKV